MHVPGDTRFIRASNAAWRFLVLIALVVVVFLAASALATIVVPVLLAALVVPVGRPLYRWLNRRLPRSLAAASILLIAIAVVVGATWLMVASILANWDALALGIVDAIEGITEWMDETITSLSDQDIAEIQENLAEQSGVVVDAVIGGLAQSVTLVGSSVLGFFLFLATFFFGVRDWDRLRAWLLEFVDSGSREDVAEFFDSVDDILRNYWKSQAYIGIFDAVAIGLVLVVLGVPLALPIAILTFVISFIPYLGAFISSALAVFVALGTAGPLEALIVLLACLFIFNTGENLVRPWLVGETVEMSTFVALLAGVVGIAIAGAFGAIVAIPLVAIASEARRAFPERPRLGREADESAGAG